MTILVLLTIIVLASCTKNIRTRALGGTDNITLLKGEKLVNMTWKNTNLWILTTSMDSTDTPKAYVFKESSSFRVFQGRINIYEIK